MRTQMHRTRKACPQPISSIVKFGAALLAGSVATGVKAQTLAPNQTPPGASAAEASPTTRFSFPPAQGLQAPAGAESIRFLLGEIAIEGGFPELEAATRKLQSDQVGKEVSIADIYVFAAKLQDAYFSAGYPLARIVVPPQDLEADGKVVVMVIDGFVEAIDVSQVPEKVRKRVAAVLEDLVGARRPKRTLLERRILIAGDAAGLALSSTLTPGRQTGATILVLSGDHDLVNGVISADNRVSKLLGDWQSTLSVALNSSAGWGERAYMTLAGHPDSDLFSDKSLRQYFAFGLEAPIGDNGFLLSLQGDWATTRPRGALAAQNLESEYSRIGLQARYPIVRSRARNLYAHAALDAAEDTQRAGLGGITTTLSEDRTRVLRLGLDGNSAFGSGAGATYSVNLAQGLDAFGARTQSDATPLKPLSRRGADAKFTAVEVSAGLSSAIVRNYSASLSVRGQYSFNDPLLRSEQFSPAGWDGLTGAPPGQLVGDSGLVARFEVQRRMAIGGSAMAAPYVFASGASVRLENPTALEQRRPEAAGAGIGVRFGALPTSRGAFRIGGTLELAQVDASDDAIGGSWLTASLQARF